MKRIVLVSLLCIMCLLLVGMNTPNSEDSNTDIELLVLVDTSGSLKECGLAAQEIEWAQKICAYCYDSDIHVNFTYFDNPDNEREVPYQTTEECLEKLGQMSHNGKKTDLESAIAYAIDYMNVQKSTYKYIVMLSDGDMDLVGRVTSSNCVDDQYPKTEEEEIAIKSFEEMVTNFSKEENQEVILVGFGKDINTFSKLAKENNIKYYSGDEGPDKAISYIFQKMAYPISKSKIKKDKNNFPQITVGYDCYRVIINIRAKDSPATLTEGEEILVVDEAGEKAPSVQFRLSNFAFVYLTEPHEGVYTINLPDDTWEYTAISQRNVRIEEVKLNLDKFLDKEEGYIDSSEKYTKYIVDCDFKLNIEIVPSFKCDETINSNDYQIEFGMMECTKYCLDKINKLNYNPEYRLKEGSVQGSSLGIKDTGIYLCRAKVISGENYYFSTPIIIDKITDSTTTSETTSDSETVIVNLGDKIDLESLLSNESKEDVTCQIGDESFVLTGKRDGKDGTYSADNGILIFHESAIYEMRILIDNKPVKTINFDVKKNESEAGCLERLFNFFRSLLGW